MEWKDQIQTGPMATIMEGLMSVSDQSELRVVLHTGRELVGVPLKVDTKNGMFLFQFRTTPPAEIGWIPFSSVSYLHLVNPAASLKGVTGGKIARDPDAAGIPSLELKRKAAKLFEGSNPAIEMKWPAEISGAVSLGISDFIEALHSALASIRQDEMGKNALAKIQKISVTPEGDLSVMVSGGNMTIQFPAANTDSSIKDKLLSTIEQAL